MRFCIRVLCVVALAASGSGCASIYLSSDPQGLEQRIIGTHLTVEPEESPKEITFSPDGVFSWKAATAHHPRLVLYMASKEGGEVVFVRTLENTEESFSVDDQNTARYATNGEKRTFSMDKLGDGIYRLQIDDQFVNFWVGPKWPASTFIPPSTPTPPSCPPAFCGGH